MNFMRGIVARLLSDTELLEMLAEYTPTNGAPGPAILSNPPPGDHRIAAKPDVRISFPNRQDDQDTFSSEVRDADVRIHLYARPGADTGGLISTAEIDAAAERLRQRCHRRAWFVDGVKFDAVASGPTAAPTDDPAVVGRLIQLRIIATTA